MKTKKILISILLTLLFSTLFLIGKNTPIFDVIFYFAKPSFPSYRSDTIQYEKINNEVNIYFDDFGVPHIEGKDIEDVVWGTGYVQGRDRFFQMDFLRRVAKGKISELVGEKPFFQSTTVAFDLSMRGWGMDEIAKRSLSSMDEETQLMLMKYTDGVNYALSKHKPIEYKMIKAEPEPWKIEDSIIVSILQGWSITHNWEQELIRFMFALENGVEKSEMLYPSIPLQGIPSIKIENSKNAKLAPAIAQEMKEYLNNLKHTKKTTDNFTKNKNFSFLPDLIQVRPSASNSWVVGKSKTTTGRPVLANDMHLTHALPSLLYLQHLMADELDVIGVTLPGLPFIISGHNQFVAWGPTSSVADVVDLVVEKIDEKNPTKVLTNGKDCLLEKDNIEISIRNKKGEFDKKTFVLRKTCHGTILNDMYPDLFSENAPLVALQWETRGLDQSIKSLYRANLSKNIDELRNSLLNVATPSQHIMAADVDGNIGFFLTGSIPHRKKLLGTFPRPGWKKEYEWDNTYKNEELPYIKNPKEDYIVNANNLSVSPYEHETYHQIDAAPSYRFDRVVEILSQNKKFSPKEIQDIQLDVVLLRAKQLMPHIASDIKAIINNQKNDDMFWYFEKLKNWDFKSNPEATEPILFFELYRNMIQTALKPLLSEPSRRLFMKQRYSTNVVDEWIKKSDHIAWDNPQTNTTEKRLDILKNALEVSIINLKKQHGGSWKNTSWGDVHYSYPKHPFSKSSVFLSFMNLSRFSMGGSLDSVWKAHFNMTDDEPFKVIAGPASRTSIDVGNWKDSKFVIDTGVSGWPKSPHYGDQYEMWKNGNLIPMIYDGTQVSQRFSHRKITFKKNK